MSLMRIVPAFRSGYEGPVQWADSLGITLDPWQADWLHSLEYPKEITRIDDDTKQSIAETV